MGVAKAREVLLGLLETVECARYNCDCQVGGVDALSLDTDYLRFNLNEALRELA